MSLLIEVPCAYCTNGSRMGPNRNRMRCHFCKGTGRALVEQEPMCDCGAEDREPCACATGWAA